MTGTSIRYCAAFLLLWLLLYWKNFVFAQHNTGETESLQRRRHTIVNGRTVINPSKAQFFAKPGRDHDEATPDYLCGATLVHSDMLLTAAHCQGSFNYGVLLYDPDTNDYTQKTTIDFQIRYPGFNGKDAHNDILLMRLSTDSGLPTIMMNSDESIPTNDHGIMKAYGFGKTTSNGMPSDALREGHFTYIDNVECSKRVMSTTNSIIWDDVLCADPYYDDSINEGSSICQGDSGGPLLDSSNILVGVISWNFLCQSDRLPDGFARVSYFHDWITEQICFYSRTPLSSNNECPDGTSPPLPANGSVQVLLTFDHDFYPEETFFRIISKDRIDQVKYAGPKYVAGRESAWTSRMHLLPGIYTLEILDMAGNGLSPGLSGSDKKGSWRLTAFYEKEMETEVASGGANFLRKFVVDFVVNTIKSPNPSQSPTILTNQSNGEPSDECLAKKLIEELSLGNSTGIICECVEDEFSVWSLSCYDTNTNNACATLRSPCGDVSLLWCCGDRRCSNGTCRSVSQIIDEKRIPLLAVENDGSLEATESDGSLRTIRGARGDNNKVP